MVVRSKEAGWERKGENMTMLPNNNNDWERIVNNEQESLDEDRTVGTQDEGEDDDPADTTPAEAEKQADEGKEIIKKMRR